MVDSQIIRAGRSNLLLSHPWFMDGTTEVREMMGLLVTTICYHVKMCSTVSWAHTYLRSYHRSLQSCREHGLRTEGSWLKMQMGARGPWKFAESLK